MASSEATSTGYTVFVVINPGVLSATSGIFEVGLLQP